MTVSSSAPRKASVAFAKAQTRFTAARITQAFKMVEAATAPVVICVDGQFYPIEGVGIERVDNTDVLVVITTRRDG